MSHTPFQYDVDDIAVSGPLLHHMDVELVFVSERHIEPRPISGPDAVHAIIEDAFGLSKKAREHFGILLLDSKNRVVAAHILHVGALNSATVSTRNVAQAALLHNAARVVLFHNHPSGDPEPSDEDVQMTLKLKAALIPLETAILDHIVIGRGETPYISIMETLAYDGARYAAYVHDVVVDIGRHL